MHPIVINSLVRRVFLPTLLLGGLIVSAPLQADAVLYYEDDEGLESQILVQGPWVRMELNETVSGMSGYMLFDSRNERITVVDDEEQVYTPITREVMDQQIQAMTDMVSDLRHQLEQLPPEMRETLEQQLGIGSEGFDAEIETRDTGESRTIGDFTCHEIEVSIQQRPHSTVCVATADALGLSASDHRTLGTLMDRLHEMSLQALQAGGPMAAEIGASLLPRVDGIPLEVREHQGVTTRLKGLSTDALSEALFRVPESYEERSLP